MFLYPIAPINLSPIFETHAANSYKKNKGIINVAYFSHASFSYVLLG